MNEAIDTLARTLGGEARGCGEVGMSHVASVIMNRVARPGWWGRDVVSVCKAPWQFSCWNANDPNRTKILAVTADTPWFALALEIARKAIAGELPDATDGADSYYARAMSTPPRWAETAAMTFEDQWHRFYRTVPPPRNVSLEHIVASAQIGAAPVMDWPS